MARNPISIRLDDNVRLELEHEAAKNGVGLATYLRDLATERSVALRRAAIFSESARVGALVESDREVREFYEDWGTPSAII